VLKRLVLHDAFLPFFLFFSDHCTVLDLRYLKSRKIAYLELVRSRAFRINDLLLYLSLPDIINPMYIQFFHLFKILWLLAKISPFLSSIMLVIGW
jgi:hypothetical protein